MARLDILTVPDPRLRVKAERVEDIAAVQGLSDDMLETLYATDNGIGLAATQVGRKEAIVIIDLSKNRDQPLVLINPQVISGTDPALGQEGCLSVPDYYADVERYSTVVVSAVDRHGAPITVKSSDFLAIVMQHEIDHLHGNTMFERLKPMQRIKAVKEYQDALARGARPGETK